MQPYQQQKKCQYGINKVNTIILGSYCNTQNVRGSKYKQNLPSASLLQLHQRHHILYKVCTCLLSQRYACSTNFFIKATFTVRSKDVNY